MKLIEYLPKFLQEIIEFKELFESDDIELENLKLRLEKVLNEAIINSAEDYGLERYEKMLNITNISDKLDIRRLNILLKLNNKVKYTYKWLISKLNEILGNDNYKIYYDFNNYELTIEVSLDYSEIGEVFKKFLQEVIPANIKLDYRFYSNFKCNHGAIVVDKSYVSLCTEINRYIDDISVNQHSIVGVNLNVKDYIQIEEVEK